MIVADLQQYFSDLARLLHSGDGKKTSSDLAGIAARLQPFRDLDLAAFGEFLEHAEHYRQTGKVPDPPTKPKPKPKSGAGGQPKPDPSQLRDEVKRLYGGASTPGVTIESIEGLRPQLDKLTKTDLIPIAEAIELVGVKSKSKADVLNAIVTRVLSIKQSAIRTSIIDRPGTGS